MAEVVRLYADKTITCVECGAEFAFSAGEQEFHAARGFTTEPKRCPACRRARGGPTDDRLQRQVFEAVCGSCSKVARLPFEPRGDRPVYCSDCYQLQSRVGGGGYRS